MMDGAMNGRHDKMHWGCCWMPIMGKGLWILSFLALLGGLLANWQGGEFMNVSVMTWYWNALVGGVLAGGAKSAYHHWCQMHSN
jgi:hypothetical protein